MAARATSSGTISFGLVSIPVKVYTATQSKSVRFNMLDPRDKSRVKQQYINAGSGEPVERDQLRAMAKRAMARSAAARGGAI